MKVILSRKGFDSQYGGRPSPILPDGKLLSIPIPFPEDKFNYEDLKITHKTYKDLLLDLGCGQVAFSPCHVDPDIYAAIMMRSDDWLPLFGQVGSAQGHLDNHGVGPGDLFLFFGWFQHTMVINNQIEFDPTDPGKHIIFGYLQIDEKIETKHDDIPDWAKYHSHANEPLLSRTNNTLYVGRKFLSWDNSLPGSGTFTFNDSLVLTKSGFSKSIWELPDFFRTIPITYHSQKNWTKDYFQSASRGQEFIFDGNNNVMEWVKNLLKN